jgi:anti-anti-sigma factor
MGEQEDGAIRIVRAAAELDWERAQAFGERLREAAGVDGALVVVDLSQVVFADSATLHVLLETRRGLADRGGRLVLAGPLSTGIRRLFDVTMTSEYFEFAADAATACGTLGNGSRGPAGDAFRKPPEA